MDPLRYVPHGMSLWGRCLWTFTPRSSDQPKNNSNTVSIAHLRETRGAFSEAGGTATHTDHTHDVIEPSTPKFPVADPSIIRTVYSQHHHDPSHETRSVNSRRLYRQLWRLAGRPISIVANPHHCGPIHNR